MANLTKQDGDLLKRLAKLQQKSELLCLARAALPIGSSRARVTSANAKWARVAEERDRVEEIARERGLFQEVCHD